MAVSHLPIAVVHTVARHDTTSFREMAFVLKGIPSRREELGLLPDAYDRSGDICATVDAGCTNGTFTSEGFDVTVRGAISDSGKSRALFISS